MKTNPHNSTNHLGGAHARPCHPQDLMIVREGTQCGNCLALVIDTRPQTPSK